MAYWHTLRPGIKEFDRGGAAGAINEQGGFER